MTTIQSSSKTRWPYALILLLILCLSVALLSKVLSYFKTGANENNIYELGHHLLSAHQPDIHWLNDDPNIGGEINEYLRDEITQSYSDAWGILNLSMAEAKDLGLKENFTELKTKNLIQNIISSAPIIRDDLSHKLQLHFISLDRQVVSFTDVESVSSISFPTSNLSYRDTSAYAVVMTLSDGKWQINKLLRK